MNLCDRPARMEHPTQQHRRAEVEADGIRCSEVQPREPVANGGHAIAVWSPLEAKAEEAGKRGWKSAAHTPPVSASWIPLSVRPFASFHSTRPLADRPRSTPAAVDGELKV